MRGDRNFKGSDSSDPSVYFLFCGKIFDVAFRQLIFIFQVVQTKLSFQSESSVSKRDREIVLGFSVLNYVSNYQLHVGTSLNHCLLQ